MTRDEAIRLAEAAAREEGWAWEQPVRASLRRPWLLWGEPYWEVFSNADMRGCNVRVEIEDATGRVLAKHFLPR